MPNPHRQVRLTSGGTSLVANLPDVAGLRVGNSVTLKDHPDPMRLWRIESISPHVREKSQIKSTWSNNI